MHLRHFAGEDLLAQKMSGAC